MLFAIIGTIAYVWLTAIERIDKLNKDKAWRECEATDWNEYYANLK